MGSAPATRRVVIAGAGGRDFHDFNTVFRADPTTRVVAFTVTQIPGIVEHGIFLAASVERVIAAGAGGVREILRNG